MNREEIGKMYGAMRGGTAGRCHHLCGNLGSRQSMRCLTRHPEE